jgi:hypothetical protein
MRGSMHWCWGVIGQRVLLLCSGDLAVSRMCSNCIWHAIQALVSSCRPESA